MIFMMWSEGEVDVFLLVDLANGQKQDFKVGYSKGLRFECERRKKKERKFTWNLFMKREPTRVGPIGYFPKKGILSIAPTSTISTFN